MTIKIRMNEPADEARTWFEARIMNMSRTGLAIQTDAELKSGSVYQGEIILHNGKKINTLIHFVRSKEKWNGYVYGGEFIGMDDNDWTAILVDEAFRPETHREDNI